MCVCKHEFAFIFCMSKCVYTCIHASMNAFLKRFISQCPHTYMHTYIHTCTQTHTHKCIQAAYTNTHTQMHTSSLHKHIHTHAYKQLTRCRSSGHQTPSPVLQQQVLSRQKSPFRPRVIFPSSWMTQLTRDVMRLRLATFPPFCLVCGVCLVSRRHQLHALRRWTPFLGVKTSCCWGHPVFFFCYVCECDCDVSSLFSHACMHISDLLTYTYIHTYI